MNTEETEIGFYLARAIIDNHEANLEINNQLGGETTSQIKVFHL